MVESWLVGDTGSSRAGAGDRQGFRMHIAVCSQRSDGGDPGTLDLV